MVTPLTLVVDGRRGLRLDVFVAAHLTPEYSRSQVARMIKAGLVKINLRPADPSTTVRPGDQVEITPPSPIEPGEPAGRSVQSREIPDIPIIHADEEIVAVNKPAGMVVHAAPGSHGPTLVDALLKRFPELATMAEPGGVMRPGIVHRLDKDTSGVMIVARTPFARASLSRQFKDRTVRKIYLALVRGIVARDEFTISSPLGRHPTDRKKISTRSRSPREAVTRITVLRRLPSGVQDKYASTLIRAIPATGRTHQIRVHLASMGHPCLGDSVYGKGGAESTPFRRQALHALRLEIEHPRTGVRLSFTALPPEDFIAFFAQREIPSDPAEMIRWVAMSG
ncbi:MAG: RluA family pseudouridine synthase [Candidatus Binataceae bacterium]|nr:RluA family pseudouridine synthase [Candidatus Binataceae bacterium]